MVLNQFWDRKLLWNLYLRYCPCRIPMMAIGEIASFILGSPFISMFLRYKYYDIWLELNRE